MFKLLMTLKIEYGELSDVGNNFLLFPYVNINCVRIAKSNVTCTYIRSSAVFGFNDRKLCSAQVNVLTR